MNRKPIINAIECENDGFLVITVNGKGAEKIADMIKGLVGDDGSVYFAEALQVINFKAQMREQNERG